MKTLRRPSEIWATHAARLPQEDYEDDIFSHQAGSGVIPLGGMWDETRRWTFQTPLQPEHGIWRHNRYAFVRELGRGGFGKASRPTLLML